MLLSEQETAPPQAMQLAPKNWPVYYSYLFIAPTLYFTNVCPNFGFKPHEYFPREHVYLALAIPHRL